MTPAPAREFHLVVWGASGFTGRLVAEYLFERFGAGGELRWALGGRNREKLEDVRSELGPGAARLPILSGDALDRDALDALVPRTDVVCSAVGPYALYGSDLVAACAEHGTHYCDITGDVAWMRAMIDRHEEQARRSGARLVHACGFDSIPSDLGCLFLNRAMDARQGRPCSEVRLYVRAARGGFSGGTVASTLHQIETARADRDVRRLLVDPYALNPEEARSGPDGRFQTGPLWDADLKAWTAPSVMALINTRIVRRSNALMDFAYGRDFRYSEAVRTGRSHAGWLRAAAISAVLGGFVAAASLRPVRTLMQRFILPDPGQGPSEEAQAKGYFDMLLVGTLDDDPPARLRGRVTGDRDPGYGSTSRMLAESALCLALDAARLPVDGGFWTPASCMGTLLIDRLEAHAGLSFELTDE